MVKNGSNLVQLYWKITAVLNGPRCLRIRGIKDYIYLLPLGTHVGLDLPPQGVDSSKQCARSSNRSNPLCSRVHALIIHDDHPA